jgi:hypothetical protein
VTGTLAELDQKDVHTTTSIALETVRLNAVSP